jgi:hypothetical protein
MPEKFGMEVVVYNPQRKYLCQIIQLMTLVNALKTAKLMLNAKISS